MAGAPALPASPVMDEDEKLRRRQRTNVIVARFIPGFLTAVVVYASYVIVGPLCVNYLISPPSDVQSRLPTGIALLVVYFLLLILMASCYLRLIYIVSFDPGYVNQRHVQQDDKKAPATTKTTCRSCTKSTVVLGQELVQLDYEGILRHGVEPPEGISEFYTKEAFVCDRNGLPLWCNTCQNWKADRVHHSRDVGRCVYRMDHFCPWVGGMVGENGFKFFVQFNIYAAVLSLYAMIVMAYFVAEAERKTGTVGDVQWAVVLGLGGFFALFTFGLAVTSLGLTSKNLTTVENIDAGKRVMYIAVILPPELQLSTPSTHPESNMASEMDTTRQNHWNTDRQRRSSRRSGDELAASIWQGTITYPLGKHQLGTRRTFAILKTTQGMNPWNLGWRQNLIAVFGNSPQAWLLPYSRSPCTKHSSQISRYPFGHEFEQLLEDARLIADTELVHEMVNGTGTNKKRKKRRVLPEGWQNGERPDAWVMEKEIRRSQKAQREREKALQSP